jgi:hypothetical protein
VLMHGSDENGARIRIETGYGFERLADEHGFAVVYPDGYEGYWNACNIVGDYSANKLNIDDVGFLTGALALSSLGDFLLGVRRLGSLDERSLFLLGLGSFLIAHLVSIALFGKYKASISWKPSSARVRGQLAIPVALGSILGILWQSLGSRLIPVLVYSLVRPA